jgi:hypothetical protein
VEGLSLPSPKSYATFTFSASVFRVLQATIQESTTEDIPRRRDLESSKVLRGPSLISGRPSFVLSPINRSHHYPFGTIIQNITEG